MPMTIPPPAIPSIVLSRIIWVLFLRIVNMQSSPSNLLYYTTLITIIANQNNLFLFIDPFHLSEKGVQLDCYSQAFPE